MLKMSFTVMFVLVAGLFASPALATPFDEALDVDSRVLFESLPSYLQTFVRDVVSSERVTDPGEIRNLVRGAHAIQQAIKKSQMQISRTSPMHIPSPKPAPDISHLPWGLRALVEDLSAENPSQAQLYAEGAANLMKELARHRRGTSPPGSLETCFLGLRDLGTQRSP
jgi:hypothetical protein